MKRKRKNNRRIVTPEADPLWYKDAIIYELHVRTFADSDDNGIGDFRGLTRKLDYLQDLGVTALWLLPFYPSPLRDDGYDIADYMNVHPDYGTLADFKTFLREAHARGLRVITELVINHTSDQHPWFQRARHAAAGSRWRDWYVWSDTPEKYSDARIIFQDFESSNWSWDPVAGAYYWHRFYSHQPDLNFENASVRKAIFKIMDYWLEMGVDGMRLDAIPYLYEREGTNCENLPETHTVLKDLRRHVDRKFDNRMLLAEANQWPDDAVAYFGDGDECHMSFHFPVMPRLFMGLRMEDRFPIVDILEQTPEIPELCQWALFLRNHDELTLEMVTDEDRDYMYRVYADDPRMRINLGIRRRLSPLLDNLRRKIELMCSLLFSLPGTPVIYYGDEIAMGDNVYLGDRNGVRTPMQWSPDRNAGFSRANPQQLYLPVISDPEYHYEAVNVEVQQRNSHSMLWWYKRIIALRKQYKAFGRGSTTFLQPENSKILAFIRQYEDEHLLVVANLSRFSQAVDLNLADYIGSVPVEVFGGTEFHPIRNENYHLTLGPHSFYWFTLEPQDAARGGADDAAAIPSIPVEESWDEVFVEDNTDAVERILPAYLKQRRWFGGKGHRITGIEVAESLPVPAPKVAGKPTARVVLVNVGYRDIERETYQLYVACAYGAKARARRREHPESILFEVKGPGDTVGVVYDALTQPGYCTALLDLVGGRRKQKGEYGGAINQSRTRVFRPLRSAAGTKPSVRLLGVEQSNTSVIFGDAMIMKVLRKVAPGLHPDLEVGRFLTEKARFEQTPPVAGALECSLPGRKEPVTLSILQGFVPNEGDAWRHTLDSLGRSLEEALAARLKPSELETPQGTLAERTGATLPQKLAHLFGGEVELVRVLGRRTAEMHRALASRSEDSAFRPEPMSILYQRALAQSMRSKATKGIGFLDKKIRTLPADLRNEAREVVRRRPQIHRRFRAIQEKRMGGSRIRIHGDYHLGQVLFTGNDFVIIDFEGEPARPLSERRLKRVPLQDVAGMLRSFHYAAWTQALGVHTREEDRPLAEGFAQVWYSWMSTAFLGAYLETAANEAFLPSSEGEIETLLDAFLIDKAIYELGYELNNRPDWVRIPLRGVLHLLPDE